MLFLTKHESDLIVLSYPYKFMSCYLYFLNNNDKLQNVFPINGNSFQRKSKLIATPYILY